VSALVEIDHADIEKTLAWLADRYRNLALETIVEREADAPGTDWQTTDLRAAAVATSISASD